MDLHIGPDDRVGAQTSKRTTKPAPVRASKGERVEPTMSTGRANAGAAGGGLSIGDQRRGGSSGGGEGGSGKPPKRGTARKASPKRRKGITFGSIFMKLFYWGFVLAIWGGIAVIGIVVYYGMQLPSSDTWAVPQRPANIRIVATDGQLISNRGKMGGEAISLRELPAYVPAAVMAVEDKRFMSHIGVDPIGILRAAASYVQAGRVVMGGSTLTQQLAKNLFLTPDQTFGRKVQEALLALWLERSYSKEQILELYLNRVYFGAGDTYGIEAASQRFFGKSARNLSLGEAAILAGVLPSPSRLAPDKNPEGAAERARIVLNEMAADGYITKEEAAAAAMDPNKRIQTRIAGAEYYVADWVESLMQSYLGEIGEDVIVSTTINWDLQKQAEFVVKEMVASEGPKRGFNQGALVAMDVDGTVRAMVGGVDYALSQYNRAVTARRQPGSAFKPFVYLAAMEKGYTPETLAEDAQFTYEGWSPANASKKYAGTVTLRQGLAYSLNTISARLAIDLTPQVVIDTAMRMGISSPMQAVPSIALGTQEVSLLELTGAYAPFANGGVGVIPNVITRIETAGGKVLYEASPAGPGQVIEPFIVAEMNDMMETAVEVGTGKGASLNGWQIGGKTGTSQNAKDALFVGYTARMVTGVWLGNDDNTKTTLSGGNVPVAIWSEFMTKAHQGLAVADLPGYNLAPSSTLVAQGIDPATGIPAQSIDPATGQPYAQDLYPQGVDPTTGQPFAQAQFPQGYDPNTGQGVEGTIDPNSIPVYDPGSEPVYDRNSVNQPYAQRPDEGGLTDLIGGLFGN